MNRRRIRCALYTRKSSEEGLEQAFNSLDAQREACAAYVESQAGEGWYALTTLYDDGGFSGGSMERPALERLLADIKAGRIDIVVVYKIDRLTRSLPDFARMIEIFDRHDVSFVSVTQAFNTTTSMGRLTLNVLLSFAQFEREVTSERIRDKFAASKAKGMWMGGAPPLGYDLPKDSNRALVVNDMEAQTVRLIFQKYVEFGSVYAVQRWLNAHGIRSKQRTTLDGRIVGGQLFTDGALYHLLRNQTYLGMIVHKGAIHRGKHPAIVETELFDAVQARLNQNRRRRKRRTGQREAAPLAGRIFDNEGHPMSPTFSYGRGGRLYRYYVSAPLQRGGQQMRGDKSIRRLSARPLEASLATIVRRLIPAQTADPLTHITRVEIHGDTLHCLLPIISIAAIRAHLESHEWVEPDEADASLARLGVPLIRRRAQTWILPSSSTRKRPNLVLISALRAAHAMMSIDASRRPLLETAPPTPYQRRLVRLAFLAPQIQRAILDGCQPEGLTLSRLLNGPIPMDWSQQVTEFGFADSGMEAKAHLG